MASPRAAAGSAAALIPPRPMLASLRAAAAHCRACPLWQRGTQTVFGEGDPHARVMLIGEQPGNDEDLAGRPFVGPAGKLLDRALAEAGIDRRRVYVTNVVKQLQERGAAARQAPHSRQTERERDRRLPAVVRRGARARQA